MNTLGHLYIYSDTDKYHGQKGRVTSVKSVAEDCFRTLSLFKEKLQTQINLSPTAQSGRT